ncbi:MAG: hypothetical protein M0Q51_13265 [Bacteroidales bacterium]|nr:hypothetical protein [Bacteroidales bacterium]
MNYQFESSKDEFLIEELIIFSLNAGLQTRNKSFPIYNTEFKNSNQTKCIRNYIKDFLLKYLSNYSSIDENNHVQKINELSDSISTKYSEILYKNRFRIGISQKIINLFLKYMWAIGKIDMPFHCPIDNIVKSKLQKEVNGHSLKDWTEIDDIKEYLKYIEIIRLKSIESKITIAQWELENWRRK